jgi:hypothetical protein
MQVWSDASDAAWAYLVTDSLGEEAGIGDQGMFTGEARSWHIFMKEAYANAAVHRTRGIARTLCIDNMALVYAISRKVSSNGMVNGWFSDWDWDNLEAVWVPTTVQKADRYTRGDVMISTSGNTTGRETKKLFGETSFVLCV